MTNCELWFHNCSRPYLRSISPELCEEMVQTITKLPRRLTQAKLSRDLFWALTLKGWSFDGFPAELDKNPLSDLGTLQPTLRQLKKSNNRNLCRTTTTIQAGWHSDFAKLYGDKLVQIEVQFGKVEETFKDFCGFRIAWNEQRLALGIEIVMFAPGNYFPHRKRPIPGMAYFEIAKATLHAIGLDCPILLIGIKCKWRGIGSQRGGAKGSQSIA